jgi:hypothetical protein
MIDFPIHGQYLSGCQEISKEGANKNEDQYQYPFQHFQLCNALHIFMLVIVILHLHKLIYLNYRQSAPAAMEDHTITCKI